MSAGRMYTMRDMTKGLGESVSTAQAGPVVGRHLRILIIDDDRDMVTTLQTILRHEGHQAWGLYRAADVKVGLKHFDPDVAILDIGLPDGSGFALAEEIRRMFGFSRPLLIAITGLYTEDRDNPLFTSIGFDHFLTKPFMTDTLLKMIEPRRLPRAGTAS
jgi:DNA-binding response OmpR family regulator